MCYSRMDDSDVPSKKRKLEPGDDLVTEERLSPTRPEHANIDQQHEDLWFDEGNVIIAAIGRSFKVHSGVLSRHSDVFRGLLSGSALAALSERLEGCPILRTEDNGESLALMLHIIYDGGRRYVFTESVSARGV